MALLVGCAAKRDYTARDVSGWDSLASIEIGAPEGWPEDRREDLEQAWRDLRNGALASADDDLGELARRYPQSAEVAAARGFLELRLGASAAAERLFDAAEASEPGYVPALSGSFLVALDRGDDELSYARLMRVREAAPASPLVTRYGPTLQLTVAEARLAEARRLRGEGRHEDAAEAYIAALEVAPEASGLYLEAAEAELAAGEVDRAVEHAERATVLEPALASGFVVLGDARDAAGDLEGAYEALQRAAELLPRDRELANHVREVELRYQRENLPPEYIGIPETDRLTRGQLAALLYLELSDSFDELSGPRNVIATDIADSWASRFIREVIAAGVLEVFPNHTFQPEAFVTRADLAMSLQSAFEAFAPDHHDQALAEAKAGTSFTDLAPENVYHDAAALAVWSGWLASVDGAFESRRHVSGREATEAVSGLASLIE